MSSALPACCLEAAGGGPCIPLASRILKDRSKPWQGTARTNSYVFHGGKSRNWDEVSMANAVEAVRRGESVRRAAELYYYIHTSRGATTNTKKKRRMNECSTGADNGLLDFIPSPTLGLRAPGPTIDPLL